VDTGVPSDRNGARRSSEPVLKLRPVEKASVVMYDADWNLIRRLDASESKFPETYTVLAQAVAAAVNQAAADAGPRGLAFLNGVSVVSLEVHLG